MQVSVAEGRAVMPGRAWSGSIGPAKVDVEYVHVRGEECVQQGGSPLAGTSQWGENQ